MIYEETTAGRLIARKVGRRTVVRRSDALRWFAVTAVAWPDREQRVAVNPSGWSRPRATAHRGWKS